MVNNSENSEDRKTRRARERAELKRQRKHTAPQLENNTKKKGFGFAFICFILGIAFSSVFFSFRNKVSAEARADKPFSPAINQVLKEKTYGHILELTPEQVNTYDIAELNLLCGSELTGTNGIDHKKCLKQLDILAEMVRKETDRNWHLWKTYPARFENSVAYYRMAMLITVLRQDYKCQYNPELIATPSNISNKESISDDVFFKDASNVFLQGLLSGKKMGTCASMPVLYTAVARRLNYPVFLVPAKAHLFCRWEDKNERRNFEGTGKGIRSDVDEVYKKFPYPISEAELKEGYYLKNLTPQQELASFLVTRSACLTAHGKHIKSSIAGLMALNLILHDNACYSGLANSINHSEALKKIRLSSNRLDAEKWLAEQWRIGQSDEQNDKTLKKKFFEKSMRDLLKTNPQDKERIHSLLRQEGITP